MKIKKGFILREVAGSYLVLAVGQRAKEFNAVINLSETGAFIWKALEKGKSQEEIVKDILTEYKIDEQQAKKDVEAFIQKLTEAGLTEL